MKMLLATAALVTLLASDALAQSRWRAYRSYGLWTPAQAYARAPFYGRSWTVYDTSGFYLGRDPDPRVRFQLRQDPESGMARSTRMRRWW